MESLTLIIWNNLPKATEGTEKKENGEKYPYFFQKNESQICKKKGEIFVLHDY